MTEDSDSKRRVIETLVGNDLELLAVLKKRLVALKSAGIQLPADSVDFVSESELTAELGDQLAVGDVRSFLRHAHSLCEDAAELRAAIVFLGPIYSYSYLAATKYFGGQADLVPVATIAAAFEEVERKQATFAVVPIENNTDGRVVDTLSTFATTPLNICGEVLLPIHHCLIGSCRRAEVVEVHSKPQALSQCRNWLASHLPDVKLVEVGSTSQAAATAASEHGIAAIASKEAGFHHGCKVIDENIEDNRDNVTRFAIIGDQLPLPTGRDKTSLMFKLNHEPGALATAMVLFKEKGINLTWIESYPMPSCPNEYLFFVELEGHRASDGISEAIQELSGFAQRLDVLGSYPAAIR